MAKKRGVSAFLRDKGIRSQGGSYNFLEEEEKITKGSPNSSNGSENKVEESDNKDCTKSVGTEPVGTKPVGTKSVGTEPVGTEPVGTEPVGTEPVGTEPVGTEPVGTEPVGTEPVGTETVGTEPVGTSVIAENTGKSESTHMEKVPSTFLAMLKNGTLTLRECQLLLAMFEEVNFELSLEFSLSYLELSKKSNIHQPHIPKALKSLVDKGVIVRSTGKGNKNFYRLTL